MKSIFAIMHIIFLLIIFFYNIMLATELLRRSISQPYLDIQIRWFKKVEVITIPIFAYKVSGHSVEGIRLEFSG